MTDPDREALDLDAMDIMHEAEAVLDGLSINDDEAYNAGYADGVGDLVQRLTQEAASDE